jgi:hypothetical protein
MGYPEDEVDEIELSTDRGKILFADLVMCWNNFEQVTKHLIASMVGIQPGIEAVTANLTGTSITKTIRTLNDMMPTEATPAVEQYCKAFELLASYRNQYVHGVAAQGGSSSQTTLRIMDTRARGKFIKIDGDVSEAELTEIIKLFDQWAFTGFDLWSYFQLKHKGQEPEVPGTPALPPKMTLRHRTEQQQ